MRRANQPGVPEDSIRLRLACLGAATVAIAASASLGEIAWATAIGAMVLVAVGMAFSHATRAHPPWWVKLLVAVCATAACFWFFHTVTSRTSGVTSVINPLTVLLVSVLVVHSFHVPSRRDLLFTLGASTGLMAVAGALAIDLRFGLFVVAWACCCLWGLSEMWTSASGGGRLSVTGLVLVVLATSTAAAAVFLVLPAPVVSSRVSFIREPARGGWVGIAGGLAGDSASPGQLSRAGSPNSRIRVGGYLGFAASLNTALRGGLGTTLVMQVRAQRPSYWVGETFDTWQGQSWTESRPVPRRALRQSSPFVLPVSLGDVPFGQSDLQTFYVANPTANLVFHAEARGELWFPAGKVYVASDGTIVSPLGLGADSSTRSTRRSVRRPPRSSALTTVRTRSRSTSSARRCSSRPLPARAGPGAEGHGGQDLDLRQGAVADRLDRQPHPLLGGHPPAPGRSRHGRRVPLQGTRGLLRADLDVARSDVALPRHSRPRGRRLRAREASTRSPTSTRCMPATPTPGSRCGSRAMGGRTSIRRHPSRRARRDLPGATALPRRGCGPAPGPSGARGARRGHGGTDGRDRALAS